MTPKHAPHPDPLAPYTLDALLQGAAKLRPHAVALVDGAGQSWTFTALAQDVETLAAHLAQIGLMSDETVIVLGSAQSCVVTALLAGLMAQVHVALVPPNIPPGQLTQLALQLNASAILCADAYDGMAGADAAFEAAARAECVRIVATLGADRHDGAVDLAPSALKRLTLGTRPPNPARIITLRRHEGAVHPVFHQQRTLVAGSLDLIARAHLTAATPVISTVAPLTYAGLAAGPLAMLLCGATLVLHGPFSSSRLMEQIADYPNARLLVPAALLAGLERSNVLRNGALGGLLALSRWQKDAADFSPPRAVASANPIVDLHAFAESALVAEPRGSDGRARAILDPPHSIDISGILMLATGASADANDALGFFGAAVTRDEDDNGRS